MIDSSQYLCQDSTDDQTAGFQAFLLAAAGKEAEVLPGNYLIQTAEIYSGTELWMKGAIFKAHPSLPANQVMMINHVRAGSFNQYYDQDIILHHACFDGSNTPGRSNSLLSFIKCKNVRLIGLELRNNSYQGINIGGCYGLKITDADMHNLGNPVVTTEGGPAIWVGAAGDGSQSMLTRIEDSDIHDLEWSAIYAGGINTRIINNDIQRVKESAVFGQPNGLIYEGNVTRYVDRKYISASGIELGGNNIIVADSIIEYTGNCAVDLTDTCQVDITGIHCRELGTEPARFPQASVIGIRTASAPYVQSTGITISKINSRNVANNLYAFVNVGGPGAPVTNLRITDDNNVLGNVYKSGKTTYFEAGKQGANCYVAAGMA